MSRDRSDAVRIGASVAGAALAAFGAAALSAQSDPEPAPAEAEALEIVVTGATPGSEIRVGGRRRAPRCVALEGDPLDEVDVSPAFTTGQARRQSAIVPIGTGELRFVRDREQVTGPTFWQRAGTGLDQYVFRAPTDGTPMCIGARWSHPEGWAQFRRITDSTPFEGKRIRFTAWAATGNARLVRFWLAAGNGTTVLHNGGNTNNQPWGGDNGWTPIMLEIGPVDEGADHISYGFLLYGQGSVWIHQPQLEIVTEEPAAARTGEFAVIGGADD